ncbi:hypothetical protein WMF28_03120 [Sorangium sp. So ce590]|uniref:hypothetical protein n=1 Tax=Sorangium sp. So ce590 TaxID=3133317 RepID=UPI003F61B07A
MTRAIKRARTRTIRMAAALLSLGVGVALLGASCSPCGDGECPQPYDIYDVTCPWGCTRFPWDGTSDSPEGFDIDRPVAVWVGNPRDVPDCPSLNYYHLVDYYQGQKPIDRCPRCVAEPLEEDYFTEVFVRRGGNCGRSTWPDATTASVFMVPAMWDGSCVSERLVLDPPEEDVEFVRGWTRGDATKGCKLSFPPEDLEATWESVVRVCENPFSFDELCWRLNSSCQPPLPPDFRRCLPYSGEEKVPACPRSHPELVQGHRGVEGCSDCEVDINVGDYRRTTSTLVLYSDEHCTQPIPAIETGSECLDLPPGAVPRSVSATLTVEHPYGCEAIGGEQEGESTPEDVVSFCCAQTG